MFPIRNGLKKGDALSPLLFDFALKYTIKRVQIIQEGLTLNGTHQLLFYIDDVTILRGRVYAIKNTEALRVARKEIGLDLKADKTKFMIMSRDKNAAQNQNIKTDNKYFDRVEH
jgi:Reverse transcriptase (RNA-dependent DNA polymerase).